MKIQRSRMVPYHRPDPERPNYWTDREVIAEYEKAWIDPLDGRYGSPGKSFMLKYESTDPETGEARDADGDTALARIRMEGAEINVVWGVDRPSITGFVSLAELKKEKLRAEGEYIEMDDENRLSVQFRQETWEVIG